MRTMAITIASRDRKTVLPFHKASFYFFVIILSLLADYNLNRRLNTQILIKANASSFI